MTLSDLLLILGIISAFIGGYFLGFSRGYRRAEGYFSHPRYNCATRRSDFK